MKRFGIVIASVFGASLFAGCGGGIQEGMPAKEEMTSAQPPGFQELMKQQSKKMPIKSQGSPKKKAGASK